jgi:hypothetical protein
MQHHVAAQPRTKVTYAATIRPGDRLLHDGELTLVDHVRRAQGRKPKQGENLHIETNAGLVRINSLDPVRLIRGAS